jgi:hypothetical protein
MDRYTFRGEGTNAPHELGTAAPPSTVGPAGAAIPASCHVLGPNQVLPRVHNLDVDGVKPCSSSPQAYG